VGGAGAAVAQTQEELGSSRAAEVGRRRRGCGRSSAADRADAGEAQQQTPRMRSRLGQRRRGGAQSRPNSVRRPVLRLFIPLKKLTVG